MTKNMGSIDRGVRLVVAGVLGLLIALGMIEGTWMIVATVVAVVFLATSFMSSCPMYSLLGLRTCPVPKENG